MRCYPSKFKLLGLMGLICLMVGMSYVCTRHQEMIVRVVGWIGVGFFGLGFGVLPRMLGKGPIVVIDDTGIEDRRWKLGVIPWDDVQSLQMYEIGSSKFLGIELIDPEKYLSRLRRWRRWLAATNRAMGFPSFAISFAGLTPGIDEAWKALSSRHVLPEE